MNIPVYHDSYIIIVTDAENGKTEYHAIWEPELPEHEPEQRDIELYRHAQPTLARMINRIGSSSTVANILMSAG